MHSDQLGAIRMKHLYLSSLAATTMLFVPRAFAEDAPVQAGDSDKLTNYTVRWTDPSIIDARPIGKSAYASVSDFYSNYQGRKLNMAQLMVGAGVTDSISIFVGRQSYLLKGRSSSSRFSLNADRYGVIFFMDTATPENEDSAAVEFQVIIPSSANAVRSGAAETFSATKNFRLAIDYGTDHDIQMQVFGASIQGAFSGNAHVYGYGLGWDRKLSPKLQLRLQGQIDVQNFDDGVDHQTFQLRPVMYAGVGYDATKFFRVEAEGTLFPSGIPYDAGSFSALSSFEIYHPGGVAGDIQHNVVGFAAIRLVFHGKL